jgi:polyphosphate glucokinase
MKVLGIDIGGSSLKGAPVDTKTGQLLAERHRIETPARLSPGEMGAAIARMAAHFDWKGPVGVGFPGVVQGPFIRTSANLHPDFVQLDAAAEFERIVGAEVSLVNDADAAGLAEVAFGAGRDAKGAVLMLTFGTGVGSAMFVDGALYPNSEFGHLRRNGESWEKYVSGAAKERRGLDYPAWAAEVSEYLRELEDLVWPDLIIAGGGISADYAKWFPHLKIRSRIVPAEFLNEAGLVGAALHAARAL